MVSRFAHAVRHTWHRFLWFIGVQIDPITDVEMDDVQMFQEKLGHLVNYAPTHCTQRKLHERLECMREELEEFEDAVRTQDLAAQLDALIDLVYFAKGTANMLGFGPVWVKAWDEVQRANMSKKRGSTKRGHAVDAVKPEGWTPPNHEKILADAGYDREEYEVNGVFAEAYCSDDPGARR